MLRRRSDWINAAKQADAHQSNGQGLRADLVTPRHVSYGSFIHCIYVPFREVSSEHRLRHQESSSEGVGLHLVHIVRRCRRFGSEVNERVVDEHGRAVVVEDIMTKLVRECKSLPIAVMEGIYADVCPGILTDKETRDVGFQRLRLYLQPRVDNDVFDGNGRSDIPCAGEHLFGFGHCPRYVSPSPLPCSLAHGMDRHSAASVR